MVLNAETAANINKAAGGAAAVLYKETVYKWLQKNNPTPQEVGFIYAGKKLVLTLGSGKKLLRILRCLVLAIVLPPMFSGLETGTMTTLCLLARAISFVLDLPTRHL